MADQYPPELGEPTVNPCGTLPYRTVGDTVECLPASPLKTDAPELADTGGMILDPMTNVWLVIGALLAIGVGSVAAYRRARRNA